MPINYKSHRLITDSLLLLPGTTVQQAYIALSRAATIEQQRFRYLLIPSYPSFLVIRWYEIELLALLSGQNITKLALADLAAVEVRAGYTPDPAELPDKARTTSLADLARLFQPVQLVDEQTTTTQDAIQLRDQHPGRRILVRSDGIIKGVLAAEMLGAVSFPNIIQRLLRSSGALLGVEPAQQETPQAQPASSEWQPYRIEAAMPQTGQIGRETEVWVKFSLPNQAGLASELPAKTRAGDLVEREAVVASTSDIEFSSDRTTLYIAIEAPDFEVPGEPRAILLRRGHASATTKLLLKPQVAGENKLVNVLIYQDSQSQATLATIELAITILPGAAAETNAPTQWNLATKHTLPIAGLAGATNSVIYVAGDMITVGDMQNVTGVVIGRDSSATVVAASGDDTPKPADS
jgi:hypothetical protein